MINDKKKRRPTLYPKSGTMPTTTLRLTLSHSDKLEKLAKRDGMSKGGWMRAAIEAAKL